MIFKFIIIFLLPLLYYRIENPIYMEIMLIKLTSPRQRFSIFLCCFYCNKTTIFTQKPHNHSHHQRQHLGWCIVKAGHGHAIVRNCLSFNYLSSVQLYKYHHVPTSATYMLGVEGINLHFNTISRSCREWEDFTFLFTERSSLRSNVVHSSLTNDGTTWEN